MAWIYLRILIYIWILIVIIVLRTIMTDFTATAFNSICWWLIFLFLRSSIKVGVVIQNLICFDTSLWTCIKYHKILRITSINWGIINKCLWIPIFWAISCWEQFLLIKCTCLLLYEINFKCLSKWRYFLQIILNIT